MKVASSLGSGGLVGAHGFLFFLYVTPLLLQTTQK